MAISTWDKTFLFLTSVAGAACFFAFLLAGQKVFLTDIMNACMSGMGEKDLESEYLHIHTTVDSLHCIPTQFIFNAAQKNPGGKFTGMATFIVFMPMLVLMILESRRAKITGLLRHLWLFIPAMQMGAGLMLLVLWMPSYILGQPTSTSMVSSTGADRRRDYPLPSQRFVLLSMFPSIIILGLAVVVFFDDLTKSSWKVLAAILGGPAICLISLGLVALSGKQGNLPPLTPSKSAQLSTVPYIACGTAGFVAWMGILLMIVFQTGLDFNTILKLLWGEESTPGVRFFLVDSFFIWIAGVLYIAYEARPENGEEENNNTATPEKTNTDAEDDTESDKPNKKFQHLKSVMIEVTLLSMLFGPGAGLSMVFAGLQVRGNTSERINDDGDNDAVDGETSNSSKKRN